MNESIFRNISSKEIQYELPQHQIAQYPLVNRDMSKLLLYRNQNISESVFSDLPNHLDHNDLLVFNNTRVIQARLKFQKDTGSEVEIFLLDPKTPADFHQSFSETNACTWKCLVGNLKKWKSGTIMRRFDYNKKEVLLTAEKLDEHHNSHTIRFSWNNQNMTFGELIETIGEIPLPPYIERQSEESDLERYQTIYSYNEGSVAAPTAGLHFTEEVMEKLAVKHIFQTEITLHVGAGTFKPVKSDKISDHEMHSEHFYVNRENLKQLIKSKENTIAVGTTSVRTLESVYWLGVKMLTGKFLPGKLHINQWEVYDLKGDIPLTEAYLAVEKYMIDNKLETLHGTTQLMIVPGYHIRTIKALITNFHQPQSTLLLLVSASVGESWKKIYKYAMDKNFRFLSYGDSSLLYIE